MDGTNFEPGVLQVEVPLDAVPDVGADRALVAELDDGAPLRLEQLADQALVGKGAVLVAVVLGLARPLPGADAAETLRGPPVQRPDQVRDGEPQAMRTATSARALSPATATISANSSISFSCISSPPTSGG
jgi:hypothetical protein